jgi:AcrR family transcriptional regulator
MVARAESTAATQERILDAAVQVFWEQPGRQLSLEEVARRAGVTVRTVLRRFGTRDGVMAAAADRETNRVRQQRDSAPPGDVERAISVLTDHYEETGDRVLTMLAEEQRLPSLREIADRGRRMHREWCARVFSASLGGLDPVARRRRLAQLVAVCDVYTWKLLRRDAGLSRADTEIAIVELLQPLITGSE